MHTIEMLDAKGLRQFGLTTGAIVAVLFGLFFPWLFEFDWPIWPWIVFGVLGVWALVAPATLGPVDLGWMWFGLQLNKVMTPLVLGVVFFLVFLPVGIVMRLFGRDPMERRFSADLKSYRVNSQARTRDHVENPY